MRGYVAKAPCKRLPLSLLSRNILIDQFEHEDEDEDEKEEGKEREARDRVTLRCVGGVTTTEADASQRAGRGNG